LRLSHPKGALRAIVIKASASLLIPAGIAPLCAWSQQFPSKPLRIIVASTPGGGADFVARLVAVKLTEAFGQQTIVENRPGGGSTLGYEFGMRSIPDGYTLTLITPSYSINPSLYKLKFDALNDYTPVVLVAKGPLVVIVHPSLPAKTLQELVALARARPGVVTYGTSGQGTIIHLATALFENMAGIKMTHVPYKGGSPALTDVIAGNIYLNFATPQTGLRQAKAGRVRALAVTTATRLNAAPELPTVSESGVPGYAVINWQALIAPKGVPRTGVERINAAVNQTLATPEMEEKLGADGVSPAGGTPEQLHQQIRLEVDVWRKTIAQAQIRLD
jgi:tripartite-type tricarboxylate transporter receptor subunit TctC